MGRTEKRKIAYAVPFNLSLEISFLHFFSLKTINMFNNEEAIAQLPSKEERMYVN